MEERAKAEKNHSQNENEAARKGAIEQMKSYRAQNVYRERYVNKLDMKYV